MNKRWLASILGAQLFFFGAWAYLEEGRKGKDAFLLETEGVDPRDLFAGQYMTLAYPAARLDKAELAAPHFEGMPYAVRLESAGDTKVAGRILPLRRATRREPVQGGDYSGYPAAEGWARGQIAGNRVTFGIERYYFSEKRSAELNALRPGTYFVQVTLSGDGQLRIQELVH